MLHYSQLMLHSTGTKSELRQELSQANLHAGDGEVVEGRAEPRRRFRRIEPDILEQPGQARREARREGRVRISRTLYCIL